MQPATANALDNEQATYHRQLLVAVEQINEADDLLGKEAGPELKAQNARVATALLLSARARVEVLEAAGKYNMVTRLTQFKRQPKT
jgi:hypothetical protein